MMDKCYILSGISDWSALMSFKPQDWEQEGPQPPVSQIGGLAM